MIMPSTLPSHVSEQYHRTFGISRPVEMTDDFFHYTFTFSIVHQEESLDFAVAHGSGSSNNKLGSTKLQVVNGGTRLGVVNMWGTGRNFQKWDGVELDPNAAIVDTAVPWNTDTSDTNMSL